MWVWWLFSVGGAVDQFWLFLGTGMPSCSPSSHLAAAAGRGCYFSIQVSNMLDVQLQCREEGTLNVKHWCALMNTPILWAKKALIQLANTRLASGALWTGLILKLATMRTVPVDLKAKCGLMPLALCTARYSILYVSVCYHGFVPLGLIFKIVFFALYWLIYLVSNQHKQSNYVRF